MARKYELKARAKRQEETRQRIAEAALSLHTERGPVNTTISAIAERAGVQRHTVYSHFPDEISIAMACSGLFAERNPTPKADALRAMADPEERLRAGLADLYRWFEGGEELLAHLARDIADDPVSQEVFELRSGPQLRELHAALADGVVSGRGHARARTAAALDLALDFHTWRRLTRGSGLARDQAVEVMVRAIRSAGRT
jgi:AcrR family transcriptional regulator